MTHYVLSLPTPHHYLAGNSTGRARIGCFLVTYCHDAGFVLVGRPGSGSSSKMTILGVVNGVAAYGSWRSEQTSQSKSGRGIWRSEGGCPVPR